VTDAERQTAYHESIWKPAQRKRTEYWQSMWEKSMHNPSNKAKDSSPMLGDLPDTAPANPSNTPPPRDAWSKDPWPDAKGTTEYIGNAPTNYIPTKEEDRKARCAAHAAMEAKRASVDGGLEADMAAELARILALFRERQAKYGPKNIAEFGEVGVLVRLYDKLARLRNFYFDGGAGDMADESVEDAWSDISCYAAIALVCKRGRWPGAMASRTSKDAL